MLRSSPIVVSGKLAANAPWQKLQTRKNNASGAIGHPADTWRHWYRRRWNFSSEVTLTTPRQESPQGYILPDDAGRKTRRQGNRLFTDRLKKPCGIAAIDEFSS
jgi:hypothetical protein